MDGGVRDESKPTMLKHGGGERGNDGICLHVEVPVKYWLNTGMNHLT